VAHDEGWNLGSKDKRHPPFHYATSQLVVLNEVLRFLYSLLCLNSNPKKKRRWFELVYTVGCVGEWYYPIYRLVSHILIIWRKKEAQRLAGIRTRGLALRQGCPTNAPRLWTWLDNKSFIYYCCDVALQDVQFIFFFWSAIKFCN